MQTAPLPPSPSSPWVVAPKHQQPFPSLLRSPPKYRTAAEILALFSPKPQPKKSPSLPPHAIINQSHSITMTPKRGLRRKEQISYEISSDSDNGESTSEPKSSFSSPQKPIQSKKRRSIVISNEEDDVEEVEPLKTPPPRLSSAGHSLRQHQDLHLSLRAQENGDKPTVKKRKLNKRHVRMSKNIIKSQAKTARNEARDFVNTATTGKRASFFIARKDVFLPLLPEGNHIERLIALREGDAADKSIPYEILQKQPVGVQAIMKPYQLLGLSFLVHMFKNGVSTILGDEMGLGKTLQTLSLIQYLKENKKSASTSENRPCLVVCPLSVLSSWMAESRRWTPGLKVLRFHGSSNERDRLKKIATGDIDAYGHQTANARRKLNIRRNAAGKPVIDLNSDLDELANEQHVDLIVTTYEGFLAEQSWFKRVFVWRYVVLDEGHKIKNDMSLISKALQGLGAEYRLILTGTPLQNNLMELWALLHWLYPEVFTERTADIFKTSFNLTKGQVNTQFMDDTRRLLEVIMLRRMKNSPGVDLNLPPKTEVLLYVPLTPMQRFWYLRLLTRADQGLLDELFSNAKKKEAESRRKEFQQLKEIECMSELEAVDEAARQPAVAGEWEETKHIMKQAIEHEQQDEKKGSAWQKLMNILMQLRKCCNHPYTLPHTEPDPYYLGEHIIHASSKFIVLDKMIEELVIKQNQKVLIFSGFTRVLDCAEDLLALRGGNGQQFKYQRLDGRTSRARRNLGIRMFNQENSEYRVMLISTRAGGLGINLASASNVIMLDQDWNPQIMLQAEARAHRIGQQKPVTVYKLCTQGTVEEQMLGRIQKKLYLSTKVTESMRDIHYEASSKLNIPGDKLAEEDMPQLGTSELMSLVRRGAQALAHPELDVNEMLGWDWPTVLEKCKDQPADIHLPGLQTGATVKEEDERNWLSQVEQVESRIFQGKKHSKVKQTSSLTVIADEWSREQRRVGKNTTVIIDGHVVSKESTRCADWEAVPTMAGKDPRLAEPKREKKAEIINQEQCQVCWDGGDLILCSSCPRSYHYACLNRDFKAKSKGKMQFHCPQHQCVDCEQNTGNAGGMIYRCRWCDAGYCEDCLDWDKTELLGENLKEYELLSFPAVSQAFYIKCSSCHDHHLDDPKARVFCEKEAAKIDRCYKKAMEEEELATAAAAVAAKPTSPLTPAGSLTTASTVDSSGINTPQTGFMNNNTTDSLNGRKRKAAPTTFAQYSSPMKRSMRILARESWNE